MVTGNSRGNPIFYNEIKQMWTYEDGTPLHQEERRCTRCGRMPTPEGYDACLGYIEGVSAACCGHGITDKIIVYER